MPQFCNYIQNGVYNAVDDRFTQGASLARTSTGAVQKGILSGVAGDGLVTAAGALQVRVAPFTAVLGDTGRGAYIGGADEAVLIPVRTPETTNNRSDLLCWRPLEGLSVDSNGESTLGDVTLAGDTTPITKQVKPGEVYWVTGTPSVSTSPPQPAVPAGAVPLARVYVAGGASTITSANITDARVFTGMHGARIAIPGLSDVTVVSMFPDGTELLNPDTGSRYVVKSGFAVRQGVGRETRQAVISVPITGTSGNANFDIPITYVAPARRAIAVRTESIYTNAQFTSDGRGAVSINYSTNGGSTWTPLHSAVWGTYAPEYSAQGWTGRTIIIDAAATERTLTFRGAFSAKGTASTSVTRLDRVTLEFTPLD